MRMVHVTWLDSCGPGDNSDLAIYEMPEPQTLHQVGFLIVEEPSHIVVAGAFKPDHLGQPEGTYDYAIAIPRCSIVEIHNLVIVDTEAES